MKLSNHPFFWLTGVIYKSSPENAASLYMYLQTSFFFFWLNWKIFIFTQFLWLSQTSNQIKMISGNSMTFQISQSCPNPWYASWNAITISHAACLLNKLINFPAVLSTKYTEENFLQVFHVWFSVEYRKCT